MTRPLAFALVATATLATAFLLYERGTPLYGKVTTSIDLVAPPSPIETALRPPRPRQRRFGFGGAQQELKLVAQFDLDKDGRLNTAERNAAREYLGGGFRQRSGRFDSSVSASGPRLTPKDVKAYPKAPVYDLGTLRTVFLQFEAEDWEDELAAFYNTDVDVPATMIVDGKTYQEVGVHFRGNSSYRMVPLGYKHSLNLALDFAHPKQDLGGYQTLNLLNSNNDPTFVRTMLYAEIARHYIPTPRVNLMRVVINGESWGIYVSVEQFNRDFVKEWFNTRDGARWKVPGSPRGRGGLEYLGDDPTPYRRIYEIKSKDDEQSWSALIALTRVLNETPLEDLETALAPHLDVDGALKFLALEAVMVNSDGYWTRASDYSIYQDAGGRFHVLPYDFNETLGSADGRGGFGERGGPSLDPLVGLGDSTKPLRSRLLAVPALRARYLGYVRDIAERWLQWRVLEPIVTSAQALIADDVRTDTRKLDTFEAFERGVDGLQAFVTRRRTFLLDVTSPATP